MTIKAPVLNRRVQGRKRYCWRICPYATNDLSDRIPDVERADHVVTSGQMAMDIRGGHHRAGWVCEDPSCPFFLGTAVTPIQIYENKIVISGADYTVQKIPHDTPLCSGIQFWEY